MKLKIVCSTWIQEEDEKVLSALEKSDKCLSAEELSSMTGVCLQRVQHTLSMLERQMSTYDKRNRFLSDAINEDNS